MDENSFFSMNRLVEFGMGMDVTGAYFADLDFVDPFFNADTIQMFGYNAGNTLVATSSILGLTHDFQYLAAGFTDIWRLEFRANAVEQWFLIDDIILNESSPPVPEPATLSLRRATRYWRRRPLPF